MGLTPAGRLRMTLDNAIRSVFSAFEQTLHLANLEAFMAAKPTLRGGSAPTLRRVEERAS